MGDNWTVRLSEYLDGELSDVDREGVEAHLPECSECRGVLEELRAVAAHAGALEHRPPTGDLWPGIAERIRSEAAGAAQVVDIRAQRTLRRRRITFSLPQLVAAGITLMVVSGGTAWLMRPAGSTTSPPGSVFEPGQMEVIDASFGAAKYDAAVVELRRVLENRRSELDSTTVRIVEQNLAIIDHAIADARAALARDPTDEYVSAHLAANMKRKIQLLRRVVAIASAAS